MRVHDGEEIVPASMRGRGGRGVSINVGGINVGQGVSPEVAARLAGNHVYGLVLNSHRFKSGVRRAVDSRL